MSLPPELLESARLDGASEWRTLWNITLPLSKAVLAVVALFYGVAHWNEFFAATLYLNDTHKWPIQLVLRQYVLQGSSLAEATVIDPNQPPPPAQTLQMAVVVIATVPILIVYPLLAEILHARRAQRGHQGLSRAQPRGRAMRITAVKRFLVTDAGRAGLYVKIETDTGLYGVGEATLGSSPRAVLGLLDDLEVWLVGADPERIEFLWQQCYRRLFFRGGPVTGSALSGIDQALWDLAGESARRAGPPAPRWPRPRSAPVLRPCRRRDRRGGGGERPSRRRAGRDRCSLLGGPGDR